MKIDADPFHAHAGASIERNLISPGHSFGRQRVGQPRDDPTSGIDIGSLIGRRFSVAERTDSGTRD